MARRSATKAAKRGRKAQPAASSAHLGRLIGGVVVVLVVAGLAIWASRWRTVLSPADEAAKALAEGRAARGERALTRASALDPTDPRLWELRLEILRVEDRQVEAQRVGWEAYRAVVGRDRRLILRAMTLALLADTPEDVARATLAHWVEADPEDVDAQVALIQRVAASPRVGDPDRAARVASLSRIVASRPDHIAAREALVLTLADSGDSDRGRAVLEAWPEALRDARYHRLRGRWDLEYDRRPARAVDSFRASLEELPQDWRTRYRLARALQNAGQEAEAKRAAEAVERLREALDPLALGRRLDKDLAALDDPESRVDLADLCERAGLNRLADAWREDAKMPAIGVLHKR
jgi:tetratricopeptide (TPR) repeat protein